MPFPLVRTIVFMTAVAVASLHATEVVIEARPFAIPIELDATAMPAEAVQWVRLQPKEWSTFTITTIAKHGQSLRKGDPLVQFDARAIDQRITDLTQSVDRLTLTIAEARQSLAQLQETAPHRLDAATRAAQDASTDLDQFTKTDRLAEEQKSEQRVTIAAQRLSNEQEELRQLKQMYAADDLTEDTEEIILVRQQDAVKHAEFEWRMAKLQHERNIDTLLPRKAIRLTNVQRDAAIALRHAETSIPREIDIAANRLLTLETELQRNQQSLANLQNDRALFEIKATSNGTFYLGALENGRWTTGDAIRSLRVSGQAPIGQTFATLVPSTTPLEWIAFTDATNARRLKVGSTGTALLTGREDIELTVTVHQASLVPETDGSYAVRLNATWPKDLAQTIHPGNPATIHLVAYQNPNAIVIPAAALSYGTHGWQVMVKLADGKTEARHVKRGAQVANDIEILSGLQPGQVIITP